MPMLSIGADLTGFDLSTVLDGRLLFYFSVFFALGYCLYSILFATIAATCTSTEELSQSMFAAVLPMVLALMSTLYVIANPSTTAARVLSLFPPFTPLVMLGRVNVLHRPLGSLAEHRTARAGDRRLRLGLGQGLSLRPCAHIRLTIDISRALMRPSVHGTGRGGGVLLSRPPTMCTTPPPRPRSFVVRS